MQSGSLTTLQLVISLDISGSSMLAPDPGLAFQNYLVELYLSEDTTWDPLLDLEVRM